MRGGGEEGGGKWSCALRGLSDCMDYDLFNIIKRFKMFSLWYYKKIV